MTAVSAPSAPNLATSSDSGSSSTDNITNVIRPTLTGTVGAYQTVNVYDFYNGGSFYLGSTQAGGDGSYSFTVPSYAYLGDGTHYLSVAVSNRNSPALTVVIDTKAPATPGAPSDSAVANGYVNKANDTAAQALSGTAEPGSTVTIYDGANKIGTTTAAAGTGAWSYTLGTLADGTQHSYTFTATDTAGNVSGASPALAFTVDITAPAKPSAPTLTSDTGTSSSDKITSNPAITYPTAAQGDTLLYSLDGGAYSSTAPVFKTDGTQDGSHTVSIEEKDAAGNVSGPSSLTFTLDTTAPSTPAAPTLTSDTGASSTDKITSNPAISYPTPAQGDTLLYSLDGGAYSSTAPVIKTDGTQDGSHTLSVEEKDTAGNVSGPSSLTFTLDTTKPGMPAAPTLTTASDSGVKGDGITNVTTPTVTGTAEKGATVKLYDSNGTTLLGSATASSVDGSYSITSSTLASGNHALSVTATDAAGNVSSPSSSLGLTIDTTADVGGDLAVSLSGNGATSAYINAAHAGATAFTVTGLDSDATAIVTFTGTGLDGKPKSASISEDANGTDYVNLSGFKDGAITVSITATDVAGNSATGASATATLDTTAPGAPQTPVLTNDTGTSSSDKITSDPSITYTPSAQGDTLLYSTDGKTYSATAPSFTKDGTYTVSVEEVDPAGNVGASTSSLTFTLDTTPPSTPAAPTLTSDTGASGTDKITSNPTISYPTPAQGDTLIYSLDGGAYSATAPVLKTDGTQDGSHTVSIEEKDTAGNASGPSSLTFTLDTTPPGAPVTPVLANDTSGGKGITSDPTITYAPSTAGDTLLYSLDNGAYSSTAPSFKTDHTADGSHTVSVEEVDAAGNVSKTASSLTFTLDTTAPGTPAAPTLTSDTGTSATDKITNNPSISYPTPAQGDTLLYSTDGKTYSATAPSFVTDGTYTVSIEEKDTAGNVSGLSSLTFTLDTTADVGKDLAVSFGTNGATAGYVDAANAAAASFSVSGLDSDAIATVTFAGIGLNGAAASTTVTEVANGSYTINLSEFFRDGTITASINAADVAGNTATGTGTTAVLDTVAPSAPAAPTLTSDTGTSSTDKITSNPAISYPTPASGDSLLYSTDGTTYSATAPSFATDGTYTVSVEEQDKAGNISGPSSLTFTLDTTADVGGDLAVSFVDDGATPGYVDAANAASATFQVSGLDADATATVTFKGMDSKGNAKTVIVTESGNGTDQVSLSGFRDGTVTATIVADDTAGNHATGTGATATIDTKAPAAPSAPTLAHDTGTSGTDKITNDPTISYPTPAQGDRLLYSTDGTSYSTTAPTFATDGSADGSKTVYVEEQDTAGNASTASSLTFTLDTTADAGSDLAVSFGTNGATTGYVDAAKASSASFSVSGLDTDATATVTFSGKDRNGNAKTVTATEAKNGAYTVDLSGFQDGTVTASITASDVAGNSATGASATTTLDTTAPSAPSLSLTTDTGASGTDKITSDPSITYTPSAQGDTLLYSTDGTTYSSTAPVFKTDGSQDGSHTVYVEEEDAAGNIGSAASLTFTLDTTPPSTPAAPALTNDTGTSGSDKLTNDPTIGYPTPAQGDTLLYSLDGGAYSSSAPVLKTDGSQDGSHTVSIEEQDTAGNVSGPSSLTFTLDTTAPDAPALALTNDTSGSQKVTGDPSITYTPSAQGDTLLYSTDGGAYSSTAPSFKTDHTADGSHTVSVEEVDAAGNVSGASSLTFTLDTTPPSTPNAPTLANDTGTSGTDKITNDPTILYPTPAKGDTLLYSTDGTSYSATAPSFATDGSADGSQTVYVEEKDTAGNISGASSLTFTLDTTADVGKDLAVSFGTNGATAGYVDAANAAAASFTVSGLDGDAVAMVTFAGTGLNGAAASTTVTEVANGSYTINLGEFFLDGTVTASINAADVAGNKATGAGDTAVLDTVAPSPPAAPTLTNDTGTSNTDKITNDPTISYPTPAQGDTLLYSTDGETYSGTAPTFATDGPADGSQTVYVEEQDKAGNISGPSSLTFTLDTTADVNGDLAVSFFDDGATPGYVNAANAASAAFQISGLDEDATATVTFTGTDAKGNAKTVTVTEAGNGIDHLSLAGFKDGTVTATIVAKDIAGNTTAGTGTTGSLDTVAPDAPNLALANDTSSGQGITSDPSITYTPSAKGDTLLYSTDGSSYSTTAPSFATDGSADGNKTVYVEEQDKAGNISGPSSLSFTLDTTAPDAPSLALANDTSDGQGITSDPSIAYTPSADGDTLLYSTDGKSYSTTAPAFATDGSADGSKTVYVEEKDTAGNISDPSSLTFTLDTIAPDAPGLALTNDTSKGQDVTSDPSLTYTPSAQGDTLLYSSDGTTYSTVAPSFATDGSADGSQTVYVEEKDTAGNISTASSLTFTLDTTAPDAPGLALTNDTSDGQKVTSDPSITYTPSAHGDTLLYSTDGTTYSTTAPTFKSNGSYTVFVEEQDTAGNISDASSLTFTLDKTAPDAPSLALTKDTGASSTDKITSNPSITYTPSAQGDTLLYSTDGTTYSTAAPSFATDGSADGSKTVYVEEQDAAGNVSGPSSLAFTLDTTAPVVTASTAPVTATETTASAGVVETFAASATDVVDGSDAVTFTDTVGGVTKAVTSGSTFGTGNHTIVASATDAAGNTGSKSFSFTVNPVAPSIAQTADGTSTTPTITGTGEVGDTITLTLDGGVIDTTGAPIVVGANGTWAYTTGALAVGSHTVTATQGANGATSTVSGADSFTINAPPAASPPTSDATTPTADTTTLITPVNNAVSPPAPSVAFDSSITAVGSTITFTGTASADAGLSGVEIFEGTTDLGAATLNGDGTWSFKFRAGAGTHTGITAVATDNQGQQTTGQSDFNLTTGILGQPYRTLIDNYDPTSGAYVGSTYFRQSGMVYFSSSYTALPDGNSAYTYTGGTYFKGKDFTSFTDTYTPDGQLATHVEDKRDGSHYIEVDANRQVVQTFGSDTIANNGFHNTFVFNHGVGAETIYGFNAGAPSHDTLSLPASDSGHLGQILANAHSDGQGGTTINIGGADTVTLAGVSVAELQKRRSDFSFHA